MAQNDFSSLALSRQCDADLPLNSVISKQNICFGDDDYVPVNFISEEVRAMIKTWELARQKQLELQEASSTTSIDGSTVVRNHASQEIHEPIRCITDGAPPKRFYRTFWRSIARQLLERGREAVLAQKHAQAL